MHPPQQSILPFHGYVHFVHARERVAPSSILFHYSRVVGHSACGFSLFRWRKGARLVKGISLCTSTRLFSLRRPFTPFAYIVSDITLCQGQFRNTCVYKVCVFCIRRGFVMRPILRVFVHPSAKVHSTIKSVVPPCIRSTSSVKATGCLHRPSTCIIRRYPIRILFTRHYRRSTSV